MIDPYCYPNTRVLRNRFNLQDEEQLKAAEARVASFALFALVDDPLLGSCDEDRFRGTHRAIFQNIYEWAGSYRRDIGTMTKGREAGYEVTYGESQFVPREMARIFSALKAEEYLLGLDLEKFASRLAYFYSEIDAIHPFRDGNSRTLRQFSSDLAFNAGYQLGWETSGRTKQSMDALYLARDLAVTQKNCAPLVAILRQNLAMVPR
jgi:cell filamentation protein